jgi:hypothetical protein
VGARAYGGGHGNCPQIDAPTRNPGDLGARVVKCQEFDSLHHSKGEREGAHTD